jgi:hypothetical protein
MWRTEGSVWSPWWNCTSAFRPTRTICLSAFLQKALLQVERHFEYWRVREVSFWHDISKACTAEFLPGNTHTHSLLSRFVFSTSHFSLLFFLLPKLNLVSTARCMISPQLQQLCNCYIVLFVLHAQKRLATGWAVRESSPGGDEIFPQLGPTQPPIHWLPGSFPRVNEHCCHLNSLMNSLYFVELRRTLSLSAMHYLKVHDIFNQVQSKLKFLDTS